MKLQHFEDANQFYTDVKDYLLRNEGMHYLLLGIINTLIHNPTRYENKPYLAVVESDGEIIAVAIRTPPRPLLLSQVKDLAAIELIAEDLYKNKEMLTGVNAPNAESEAFAQNWTTQTGESYKLKMALRSFQIEQVKPVNRPNGYLRLATYNDKKLLKQWNQEFSLEALGDVEANSERWVNNQLRQGTVYLWQDKTPVSIACQSGLTPNGTGINMVYTPTKYRRKGYASATVAALSQYLLKKGFKYCFLFTDLSNPTSNHIYQEIGFQPVGDWREYCFF